MAHEHETNRLRGVAAANHGAIEVKGEIAVRATVDPASILSGAMGSGTVAMVGVNIGDEIVVIPGVVVPAGVFITGTCSAAGTITWSIFNITGGAYDAGGSSWLFIVKKRHVTT